MTVYYSRTTKKEAHERGLELLWLALGERFSDVPHTLELTERGKPFIPGLPGFHFNISHSGDLVLLALSDAPLGIDIEMLHPIRRDLPKRFFTDEENAFLAAFDGDDFDREALILWTRKEARAKASGEGLCLVLADLGMVDRDGRYLEQSGGFYLVSVPFPNERYVVSAALSFPAPEIELHEIEL